MPATVVQNVGRVFDITDTIHPAISYRSRDWRKWRLTYEGGEHFIVQYLEQFSNREDEKEFEARRRITYCPAFAKKGLKRIRNSVFSRGREIVRDNGPSSYQLCVAGKNGGIDLSGASMNYFMGVKVLDELLKMSIVGIYVDMPQLAGPTLLDKGNDRPYCYLYQAEQIRSYTVDPENPNEFTSLVLVDSDYSYDDETLLPIEECERYRYLYLKETDDGVRAFVRWYKKGGIQVDFDGQPVYNTYGSDGLAVVYEQQIGNLTKLPFVLLDIGDSILSDTAQYQIAHLNMASGDVWYCTRANFPFYTEAYDPNAESGYIRRETDENFDSFDGFNSTVSTTTSPEIVTGPTRGRKYPKGTERPAFIHPSPEPLTASMAKQEQMKKEIDELMNQTLASLTGEAEESGVLSGINFVAYILQYAENKIGMFWAMYEGTTDFPVVLYPETPEITDPKDVQTEVVNLLTLIDKTPQLTLKKALLKKVVRLKLGSELDQATLLEIYKEIDASKVVIGDPSSVISDAAAGLVGLKTASMARGYPEDEADAAKQDHTDRLQRIAASQTSKDGSSTSNLADTAQARGIRDLSANPDAGKQEKAASRDTTNDVNPQDQTRGAGQ